LRPEGEPGIVILVRRRTRQAEIAAMQKLLTRAGEHGLRSKSISLEEIRGSFRLQRMPVAL
jgi:hypothetical protein